MSQIIHIKSLSCDLDYPIRRFILFVSKYFEDQFSRNREQTEFFLPESLKKYDKSTLIQFFSEFGKSPEDYSSINTFSGNVLLQLLELSYFFQVSDLIIKINDVLREKCDISFFIKEIIERKVSKSFKEEESIIIIILFGKVF